MTTGALCSVGCLTNGSSHAGYHGGSCGEQSPCRRCPRWPVEQSPTDSLRLCGSTMHRDDCPGVCPAPETSWWQEIPLPTLYTERENALVWGEDTKEGRQVPSWHVQAHLFLYFALKTTSFKFKLLTYDRWLHFFPQLTNEQIRLGLTRIKKGAENKTQKLIVLNLLTKTQHGSIQ